MGDTTSTELVMSALTTALNPSAENKLVFFLSGPDNMLRFETRLFDADVLRTLGPKAGGDSVGYPLAYPSQLTSIIYKDINFTSSFGALVNLGGKLTVPQPGTLPEEKTPTARGHESDPEQKRIPELIARRDTDGYTMIRHCTVTGEVTASIMRGPFTPTLVPHPVREGFAQINFSTDLQILDRDLALMDLTYANAWQLGKGLVMGDAAFFAVHAHLRNSIYGQTLAAARTEVHSRLGGFRSRAKTAAGMLDLVQGRPQPAQQIASQSSYLPEETLRFFRVDEEWIDALDGALSLAEIKPDKALGGWHVQMPKYGFLLRSAILVQFSDLSRFSAERPKPYRFVVSQTLTETQLTILYSEISTHHTYKPRNPAQDLRSLNFTKDNNNPDVVFNWGQRTMNVENYGRELVKKLRDPERMMKDGKYLFKDELAALPGDSRFQLSTPPKRYVLLPRKTKAVQVPRPGCGKPPAEKIKQTYSRPGTAETIIIFYEPYFKFKIYPVRQREFIHSSTVLLIDLIFSLRQQSPRKFITPLVKLVIAIPFGAIRKKKPLTKSTQRMIPDETIQTKTADHLPPFTPLLGPNPDPPMPAMLSNIRFNIINHFGTKEDGVENHLIPEVIPPA
ncbi:hypothetical protein FDENT_10936 [Fusarium denticulatum]|uniref:Uncharacterized protein n=1 Tax=Fusarium denticulatum TaxID=48507 RepID=A0A8H5TL04_9HYPO|nr:hypothetical protein FDENT_10936 [Fusarium denticulatum]